MYGLGPFVGFDAVSSPFWMKSCKFLKSSTTPVAYAVFALSITSPISLPPLLRVTPLSFSFSFPLFHQRCIPLLPRPSALSAPSRPLHHPWLQHRPPQQPGRREDEDKHHSFILDAVSLETLREHVFLLRVGANGQFVREAEGAVAGCAG